ncbi:MAG: hypothetical protein BGO77_06745 [Caedibacter sp. 37-49]|nr:MAG: hypothetical protein BGO77_06745 [Caedibacter sp. 37-49]
MGGDQAPYVIIEGLARIVEDFKDITFQIYGSDAEVLPLLKNHQKLQSVSTFIPTTEIISADTKPSAAVRGFKDSSMRQAIMAVREKRADGVISAGNTGAYMALAKIILGTLEGIDRPAITGLVPSIVGPKVMLDLGANVDVNPQNIIEFSLMGVAFAKIVLQLKNPSVGLLNIGSEELKGNAVLQVAQQMLRSTKCLENYYGFIEGDDISKGTVDVIVADGFMGNISLKTMEGTARLMSHFLRQAIEQSLLSKVGALLARPALKFVKNKLDPSKYNGAPFLGLKGIAVKSHGGTDIAGFYNAVMVTADMIRQNINQNISNMILEFSHKLKEDESSFHLSVKGAS